MIRGRIQKKRGGKLKRTNDNDREEKNTERIRSLRKKIRINFFFNILYKTTISASSIIFV